MIGKVPIDRFRLVLFDLDGTLVDSIGDLAWCGNQMLRELGLGAREPEAFRAWVGNGVERFVKRSLTGDMEAEPDEALFEQGLECFNALYAENISVHSRIYPGVESALERFARCRLHLACVTNKPEPFTSRLLDALGLATYFELVVAGNTTARKKPDPMPLHYAADYFELDYHDCLMVGDSTSDVRAARAAGFAIVCVPYGYNHGKNIRDAEPDLVVEDLTKLADMFA